MRPGCLCGLLATIVALFAQLLHLGALSRYAQPPGQAVTATADPVAVSTPADPGCLGWFHVVPAFESNRTSLSVIGRDAVVALTGELRRAGCLLEASGRTCPASFVDAIVEGHADERPTQLAGGNDRLSLLRANEVTNYLSSQGVEVRTSVGLGATRPAPTSYPDLRTREQRWADDRRVEVTLVCPE